MRKILFANRHRLTFRLENALPEVRVLHHCLLLLVVYWIPLKACKGVTKHTCSIDVMVFSQ